MPQRAAAAALVSLPPRHVSRSQPCQRWPARPGVSGTVRARAGAAADSRIGRRVRDSEAPEWCDNSDGQARHIQVPVTACTAWDAVQAAGCRAGGMGCCMRRPVRLRDGRIGLDCGSRWRLSDSESLGVDLLPCRVARCGDGWRGRAARLVKLKSIS